MEVDEEKMKTKGNKKTLGLEQIEESNESVRQSDSRSIAIEKESNNSGMQKKNFYNSHSMRNFKEFSKTNRSSEHITARINESMNNCIICFENIPDAVFMECGHGGICYECSLELWKTTGECYLCRNVIIPSHIENNSSSPSRHELQKRKLYKSPIIHTNGSR